MNIYSLRNLAAGLLLPVILAGCSSRAFWTTVGVGSAAVGGAAVVYYTKGDLEAEVPHDVRVVYKSAVGTVNERNYKITEQDLQDSEGFVKAKVPVDSESKDLTIKMNRLDDGRTHLSIRVGVFGDETLSRAIMDDIRARLAKISA